MAGRLWSIFGINVRSPEHPVNESDSQQRTGICCTIQGNQHDNHMSNGLEALSVHAGTTNFTRELLFDPYPEPDVLG